MFRSDCCCRRLIPCRSQLRHVESEMSDFPPSLAPLSGEALMSGNEGLSHAGSWLGLSSAAINSDSLCCFKKYLPLKGKC